MTRPTIEKMWTIYARRVLPANVGPAQARAMRHAFYAGCYALLLAQHELIGSDEVSEDEGVECLEEWTKECARFAADVTQGKA